ncbi:hypothetical protein ACFPRL_11910 [Pseudoclavibacter helvolus]
MRSSAQDSCAEEVKMSGRPQPHCVGHVDTRLDYASRGFRLGR